MIGICLLFALLGTATSTPLPQSSVYVKFASPTQNYAHGVELAAPTGSLHAAPRRLLPALPRNPNHYVLAQPSYYRGPRRYEYSAPSERRVLSSGLSHGPVSFQTAEAYAPLPPSNELNSLLALDSNQQQLYYSDPPQHLEEEIVDPLLLTGDDAIAAVKYLFGRGELYWDAIPHARALERHQEERRQNGLEVNRLSSNRPESPYFRGGRPYSAIKNRRGAFFAY